ncbi:MAG: glycosyltransferase family 2 protein [Bdellovibrionota bacterium]|nr:glycosyltransferase family 2 protein [Pseudomonadota bacterium]MDY6090383.1 glycosyltransferase family 2 protein [Bdellovibrionota bacterium]
MTDSKIISIIVPCCNEEDNVLNFYREVTNVLQSLNFDYEIIFIDDGSTDNTNNILIALSNEDKKHIKYISFTRNFGKEAAMYAGLKYSKGDFVTIMDADLQHPPKLLPTMIEILENSNYDNVSTMCKKYSNDQKLYGFLVKIFYGIMNKISDVNIVHGAKDFCLMRRNMVDAVLKLCEYERFSKGIFQWVGYKTYWLECEHIKRIHGKSKWCLKNLLKYALSGISDFSVKPLFLSLFLGLLLTTLPFLLILLCVIKSLFFHMVINSTIFIVLVLLFVGGIELLCVGILSYYVAKIFKEVKNRPNYIIKESNLNYDK